METKLQVWSYSLLIFAGLFLILEIGLRLSGYKPGTLDAQFYPLDTLISEQRFRGDTLGITTYIPGSPHLPPGYNINRQGFRSPYQFARSEMTALRLRTGLPLIMLIGDSYTVGCCADPVDSSFADRLLRSGDYLSLNFGVGTTDLIQYQLIVEHYLDVIRPDLVVLCPYLGNDLPFFERPVSPNVPSFFQLQDFPWMQATVPPHLADQVEGGYLRNGEEAYAFYLSNYTLWHPNASKWEKMIRQSIVLSQIYLGIRERRQQSRWWQKKGRYLNPIQLARKPLKRIQEKCRVSNVPLLILGIPTYEDIEAEIDLISKYDPYFEGMDLRLPKGKNFSTADYDSPGYLSHFNNSGHRKWYEFMKREIDAFSFPPGKSE